MLLCSCSCTNAGSTEIPSGLADRPVLVGDIPCAFPLVKEDTDLNVLCCTYNGMDASDILVWQKYEEMTGVTINWSSVKKSTRDEAVYTALANKTATDLILRCKISANLLTQYGESGYIYDLAKDGMLEKYAPNCWAYLQSHPEALASITNPDGSIYSLPQINSGAELRVSRKLYINKRWLDNVGMGVPRTTEELYRVLRVFKERDANGNGDVNDEIPLCPIDWSSMEDAFFGSFGLGTRGNHNYMVDYDEENACARFIPSSDGYRTYLEYFRRLYSEGLLDKYVFSVSDEKWANNAANDLIGVFASTNLSALPADRVGDWIAIEEPLTGPDGDKLWSAVRANFHSVGAAVIPTTCDNPELVLRWLDYFWTDEGTLFYHMGVENDTYLSKPNGNFDYADKIYDDMEKNGVSFDDAVAKYTPYPGGSNPTVEIAPYFMGGEMAPVPAAAAVKLFAYGPKEYWPSFTFTSEENETLNICQSDLKKYIDTSRVDFITGKRQFAEWNGYKKQLKALGEQDVVDIYASAAERYEALKTGR